MSSDLRYKMAGRRAVQLLDKLGKNALPIDPFVIAADYEITVKPTKFDKASVFGCLVRVG